MYSIRDRLIINVQSAALLTFAVYQLSEHPDILARLREEILNKVGSTRRPDYDDIRDMKFLRAVINGEVF